MRWTVLISLLVLFGGPISTPTSMVDGMPDERTSAQTPATSAASGEPASAPAGVSAVHSFDVPTLRAAGTAHLPAGPRVRPDDLGFRFVRVRYEDTGGRRGWRRGAWATDYPRAELHLHEAIDRTTGLYLDGPPIVLTLTDERIFEHPVLYLTEPGYWQTNDEEVESMKKYFARGGFMIVDDFHDYGRGQVGPQWNNFYNNIKQVFPEREPVELTADHPIWSIYYDIDPDAAISTKNGDRAGGWGGMRFGPLDDIYYGIFDDNGRMVVVICYNQDIGDGWEWPETNMGDISTVSFQMAINFIVWALTH